MYKEFTMKTSKIALALIAMPLVLILSGCAYTPPAHCNGADWVTDLSCRQPTAPAQAVSQSGYSSSGSNSSNNSLNNYLFQQNIQNSINQLTAPRIQAPTPTYTNQNQNPFYSPPQQPLTNPSVNCVPNGVGGFRCQ